MPRFEMPEGISIVMPAFGVHDVLPLAVEAAVVAARQLDGQAPWECLVVDDANDPPLELPKGISDEVAIIRSDVRRNCGGARNLGLANARYGLVCFCDADTLIRSDYLVQHCARHKLARNLITVSMREFVPRGGLDSLDSGRGVRLDSRIQAEYVPGRLGLVPVDSGVIVRPLEQTRDFRDFGRGRLLGPVDLPFMVKGNNLVMETRRARGIWFPTDFVGWGPEDVCFAAKAIARGAFVVPVISTSVVHYDHEPRSGSERRRDEELRANLLRYERHLDSPAVGPWLEHHDLPSTH